MAALIKRGGDGGRPILDNKPGLDYSVTKRAKGIPTTAEARNYPYPQNELAFVRQYRQVCVDGKPQQAKEKLETLAAAYQTDDLSYRNHLPRLRPPAPFL